MAGRYPRRPLAGKRAAAVRRHAAASPLCDSRLADPTDPVLRIIGASPLAIFAIVVVAIDEREANFSSARVYTFSYPPV
jgi:hypothetical protein